MSMFSRLGGSVKAGGPAVLRDVAGLAGAGSIAYGAWLVVPAAGFIVAGALLMVGAWLHARTAG
jgi:hypothetical protein